MRSLLKFRHTLACWLSIALVAPVFAANWPAWRGPTGDGVCAETGLPVKWSPAENVKWKTPLPERGNSSPIVYGDRVFLTQAIEKEGKRLLLCFDRATGKELWRAGTTYPQKEPTHGTNPYCSGSPVTDGERVIVSFASRASGVSIFPARNSGIATWARSGISGAMGPPRSCTAVFAISTSAPASAPS